MYYICENDKPNMLLKKFNIIKVEGNKIFLPISKEIKVDEKNMKKQNKLAKKTNEIIKLTNTNKVVLSKHVREHTIFLNQLYTYGLDIVDGKWLFYMLIPETLQYILDKQNWTKEQTTVYILANDINDNLIQMLKSLTRYL